MAVNARHQENELKRPSARVQPRLRDLMSLARAAMHLPSWHDRARRQTQGAYLSALRGRGMEYDESRPYQAGDDIRTLDWRVTARTGKPHTKLFREERERPVFICCDLGRSMRFATQGSFKSVVAARAASLLAWKAQQSGDRIGGVIFDSQHHLEMPPERGKQAVARLLKGLVAHAELAAPNAVTQTPIYDLSHALIRLQRLAKPGSLIFVISDFRNLDFSSHQKDSGASLLANVARHSETFALAVADPLEMAAPELHGRARISDGVQQLNLVLGNKKANIAYQQDASERQNKLKSFCASNRVRLEYIMTNDDPVLSIERLLR